MKTAKQIKKEARERFVEQGANLEHERWVRWQRWCHKVLRENCPSPELERVLARWDRQIKTKYKDLSEQEKESDRKEVRKYTLLISNFRKQSIRETLERVKLEKKKVEMFNVSPRNFDYNQAVDDLTNLKKKLLEESEG